MEEILVSNQDWVDPENLDAVIEKLEEIVDSDLGTLQTFIEDKNPKKLTLKSIFEWIYSWAEGIWTERMTLTSNRLQSSAFEDSI